MWTVVVWMRIKNRCAGWIMFAGRVLKLTRISLFDQPVQFPVHM